MRRPRRGRRAGVGVGVVASSVASWVSDELYGWVRGGAQASPPPHRRPAAVAATAGIGAGLLARSLSAAPGSRRFQSLAGVVAATWAVGGALSGPLRLGSIRTRSGAVRRPLVVPAAVGATAFGGFYVAALVARRIPVLDRAVSRVLEHAHAGSTPLVTVTTLANGAAEELFFRGTVYGLFEPRHPLPLSTACYTAITLPTRNPALVVASAAMGVVFGLERRQTGGIAAPAITHVVWSGLMLRYLPRLFAEGEETRPIRRRRGDETHPSTDGDSRDRATPMPGGGGT